MSRGFFVLWANDKVRKLGWIVNRLSMDGAL
jgi:hypothetical protein